jgi:uncharacterized protein YaaW (UPF0174 family)
MREFLIKIMEVYPILVLKKSMKKMKEHYIPLLMDALLLRMVIALGKKKFLVMDILKAKELLNLK